MTAEVAVMNRQAVALAADSAVTVESGGGRKAWESANKIFGLARTHAVGLMIYGNADFMRLPWETLIKIYRDQLTATPLSSVTDYTGDFLKFLRSRRDLFPDDEQALYFFVKVVGFYREIRDEAEETMRERISSSPTGALTMAESLEIFKDTIVARQRELEDEALHTPGLPKTFRRTLRQYAVLIPRAKKEVFQKLPLTAALSRRLTTIAYLLFEKSVRMPSHSGLVVAGFGADDLFPRIEPLQLDGMAGGRLMWMAELPTVIDRDNRAGIRAFAQSDSVYAFMEGVDAEYQDFITGLVSQLLRYYPAAVVDGIAGLSKKQKTALIAAFEKGAAATETSFTRTLDELRQRVFAAPVVDVVSVLPKEDLAAMAETLVNLTSFRHKVSMQVETVGGPIDVAMISKGDGFIWMKRKNYFDIHDNPHFSARYR